MATFFCDRAGQIALDMGTRMVLPRLGKGGISCECGATSVVLPVAMAKKAMLRMSLQVGCCRISNSRIGVGDEKWTRTSQRRYGCGMPPENYDI